MTSISLSQYLNHVANGRRVRKKERKIHFVLGVCLAGVLIGLYAGIVTKSSEAPLRTDWNFAIPTVAADHSLKH
jgi:hypothetical protein